MSFKEVGRHTTTTEKSETIKKGSILAFEIRELHVDECGRLDIMVSCGDKGKLAYTDKPAESVREGNMNYWYVFFQMIQNGWILQSHNLRRTKFLVLFVVFYLFEMPVFII